MATAGAASTPALPVTPPGTAPGLSCPQRPGGLRAGLRLRNSEHTSRLPPSLLAWGGACSRFLGSGPRPPPPPLPRLASGPAFLPPYSDVELGPLEPSERCAPLGERDSPPPAECGSGDKNPGGGTTDAGKGVEQRQERQKWRQKQRNSERGTDFPQTYPIPDSARGSRPFLLFSPLPDLFPESRRRACPRRVLSRCISGLRFQTSACGEQGLRE